MKTIVAQVYVKKDNKILMVEENRESKKGKWNMPAGKLEENETLIDTCIREVKEETNIDISINGLIAIEEKVTDLGQLIIIYFLADYVSGEISFDKEEINDVKWMSEKEIKELDKSTIRGSETIDNILSLAKEPLSLDRIMIENLL